MRLAKLKYRIKRYLFGSERQADTIVHKDPWYFTWLFWLYPVVGAVYFYWRIIITLNWDFLLAWPLLFADMYTIVFTLLFLITSKKIVYPKFQSPLKDRLVDILIPTKNESPELVELTATAAQAVRGVNKVFILNDGDRQEIRSIAEKLGTEHVSRVENTHAKAGNMNLGLQHSHAEFVVFLDCDFVPQPQMIERLSGYFREPELAFVQTPQVFYNHDLSIQHRPNRLNKFWSEQSMFYGGIQPAKNKYNAAFFCGTNAMLRRAAIDDIGGLATGTATEDVHTAIKMHARGWKSWYIKEELAYGLAPGDIREYYRQRTRWGAGSLGLLLRSKDSPLIIKGMAPLQRLCYLSSTSFFVSGIIKLIYFSMPIISIFTLSQPSNTTLANYWLIFMPFMLISLLVTFVFSRGTYHPLYTEQYNVLNIFSNIASLKGIWKIQRKFGVSIKNKIQKEGIFIYNSIVFMMAVMLIAGWYAVFYWFYVNGGSWQGFVHSDLLIGVIWNSINLVLVMTLLTFLKKFYDQDKKTLSFQNDQPLEAGHGSHSYKLKNFNLQGVTVIVDKDQSWTDRISLPISYNQQIEFISGVVEQVTVKPNPGILLQVKFDNLTSAQRRMLIYYLTQSVMLKKVTV